jgi:hypothetical protein
VSDPSRPVLVIPASGTTSLPRLPAYVEHGGEIACRHPADAINSRMYGFVLQADRACLDAYCDRCFNAPTGGEERWRPISDQVLLNFVDIPTMGSTDTGDVELGVTHEREAAIWFPVYEPRRRVVAWAIPYMFVDSGLALAGGREVYGFPKQLGTLEIPRGPNAPAELRLNTVTFDTYGPDSEADDHRVVTVTRPGGDVPLSSAGSEPRHALDDVIHAMGAAAEPKLATGDVLGWLGDLLREGLDALDDVVPDLLFFGHLVEEHAPMLLLKQFRDAHVPGAACYQALVLVDLKVLEFRDGGLLPDDYDVTLNRLDGEPVSRELGVADAGRPRVAFWLDFDFLVELGDILWEAPVG